MTITEYVISNLESTTLFDGRYSNLKCINIDITGQKERQGVFSVIFEADDIVINEHVIIKIYDPAKMTDPYRQLCFDRESAILSTLLNKNRCLQLKGALKNITIQININGVDLQLPLKYFVTEFLPISIIESFYNKGNASVKDKLLLFKDIVLSVRALHSHEVYHRDLKPDNIRAYLENLKRIVVAIDLGTAVKEESPKLLLEYGNNVGALGYASPEAYVGFASNRKICFLTDLYAIGCMLFELFNQDFFFIRMYKEQYFVLLTYLKGIILATPERKRWEVWDELIKKHALQIHYPLFSEFGFDIPIVIQDYLTSIFHGLIDFNYRSRLSDFDYIINNINICIKIIETESLQREILKRKKEYRMRRLKNKEAILVKYCRYESGEGND